MQSIESIYKGTHPIIFQIWRSNSLTTPNSTENGLFFTFLFNKFYPQKKRQFFTKHKEHTWNSAIGSTINVGG